MIIITDTEKENQAFLYFSQKGKQHEPIWEINK